MSKRKKLTFKAAREELNSILLQLESPQDDLDTLRKYATRASELITYCRDELRSAETEIQAVFDDTTEE